MSVYIRDNAEGSDTPPVKLAPDCWDLDEQLECLLQWFKDNTGFDFGGKSWIADIGFSRRKGPAVPGYTVSVELMALMSANNVTLLVVGILICSCLIWPRAEVCNRAGLTTASRAEAAGR